MTEARAASQPEDTNVPILVRYGNTTLDFGMANIPKVFLRFYTYLRHGEFKLLDSEAMMLVEVIGLYGKAEDGDDYELRTRNLPMATSDIVRERYIVKFRRMGLVFTERLYFPGYPSRLKAIRWDMRSLFFNLEQVAERWRLAQRALLHAWHSTGAVGHRPVYAFPESYTHAITLPLDVAVDVAKGVFWPTTEEWSGMAAALCARGGGPSAALASTLPKESGTEAATPQMAGSLSTLPKESGTDQPKESGTASTLPKESGTSTLPKESGTGSTLPKESGHLIKTLNGGGGGGANPLAPIVSAEDQAVLAHFEVRLGQPHAFSDKEFKALVGLRAAGYSQSEILAGVDQAFNRPGGCRHFTFVAARLRNNPPAVLPEAQTPEGRRQPAPARKLETGASAEAGDLASEAPPELAEVIRILKEHGETLTSAKLARLKRMAQAYQPAAARHGATAAAWLEQAMTQGLGEAKSSLIGFADTILRRWSEHGPDAVHPRDGVHPRDAVVEKTGSADSAGKARTDSGANSHRPATRKSTATDRIARTAEALRNYRRADGQ